MKTTYFLTGGTGFVGRNILKVLLNDNSDNYFKLLVRSHKGIPAIDRIEKMLLKHFSGNEYRKFKDRVEIIEGSITEKKFGLSGKHYELLTNNINIIFHSAATIKFNLSVEAISRINVNGTRNLLNFAEKCLENGVLQKVNHISTAYVIGRLNGSGIMLNNYKFANTYEISKYKSEQIVKKYFDTEMPITIFRPSIITGDSISGEIPTNSIVYMFLLMLSRESLPQLPCDDDTSLNIIPMDIFIDAMLSIANLPESNHKIFNLTNSQNANLKEMIVLACKELDVTIPEFIPMIYKKMVDDKVLNQIEPFIPYFEDSHHFNLADTNNLLNSTILSYDAISKGLKNIISYCLNNKLLRKKRTRVFKYIN